MNDAPSRSLLDRTLSRLRDAWQGIAGSAYDDRAASMRPDLPEDDVERLREQMQACLETRGGEVSARARAAALGRAYLALDSIGRGRFLGVLAQDFDVDRTAVDDAMVAVQRADDTASRLAAEGSLRQALTAPRLRLLTQFTALPEGVKFLVDLRAELLPLARRDPLLKALDDDVKGLLNAWFDVAFLELQRIAWDSAPAALLEKLIAYEAVHTIRGWEDLKNRLDSDRRCFAFFHPRMPDEPLIFVEVALVDGMAGDVQNLLDEQAPLVDPRSADSAIFYSISNCQQGLAGISFGNFLIKGVVDRLSREHPGLKTFATLSPIPGFRSWLDGKLAAGAEGLLENGERKALGALADNGESAEETLKGLLDSDDWHRDEAAAKALRPPLMRLCAHYLMREKRDGGNLARDPVAHFHLTNGARMERLNWLGDRSQRGLEQSAGIMINYLYRLPDIDDNHEAYTAKGRVAASSGMRGLL